MASRPKLTRGDTVCSNPYIDLDQYDMFESRERQKPPYNAPKTTQNSRNRPRRTRIRRNQSPELEPEPDPVIKLKPVIERELQQQIPDTAKIMKSLNNLRNELEYLTAVGIVSEDGMGRIMRELPRNIPVFYSQVGFFPHLTPLNSPHFPDYAGYSSLHQRKRE